jgi:hypothetical protein
LVGLGTNGGKVMNDKSEYFVSGEIILDKIESLKSEIIKELEKDKNDNINPDNIFPSCNNIK